MGIEGLLIIIAAFFLGVIVLLVSLGCKEIDVERERRTKEKEDSYVNIKQPLFIFRQFGSAEEALKGLDKVSRDHALLNIEKFLQREQSAVDRFLAHPSAENLYENIYDRVITN